MTTPPNLTKLNFEDIKTSLTDYLKNQSILVGYNFEGSVIQTLINLLAYNTYYYAFYSNMMSSELFLDSATRAESIISLVKPLGYTVPGKKSASTIVKIINEAESILQRYTLFNVVTNDGKYYNFYNPEEITLTEGIGDNITVIEASNIIQEQDITSLIDFSKQRYILDDPNVDISTIRIEVKHSNNGSSWEEWTNANYFPNNDEDIFYVDRMGSIFTIEFGKFNNLGKSLETDDQIRITYLVSSGSQANELFHFSLDGFLVLDVYYPTSGGNDGPDLNLIKYVAPKIFSSQERAVTKQDYYGLLVKNNLITDVNQVSIYGGDEIYPPKYGRVFVSYIPFEGNGNADEIISFLREKNLLTVLPEYIIPSNTKAALAVSVETSSNLSSKQRTNLIEKIKTFFTTEYQTYINQYAFNLTFNFDDFQEQLETFKSSGLVLANFKSIQYTFTSGNRNTSEFSLNNTILRDLNPFSDLTITDKFFGINDYANRLLVIRLPRNIGSGYLPFEVYEVLDDGSYAQRFDIDAGSINFDKGHFYINKIYYTDSLNIKITSLNPNISQLIAIATKFGITVT